MNTAPLSRTHASFPSKYVTFTLGQESYGLPVLHVREILELRFGVVVVIDSQRKEEHLETGIRDQVDFLSKLMHRCVLEFCAEFAEGFIPRLRGTLGQRRPEGLQSGEEAVDEGQSQRQADGEARSRARFSLDLHRAAQCGDTIQFLFDLSHMSRRDVEV